MSSETSSNERSERPFYIPGRQRGQRVGMFVDVQNMFYSAKHLYHAKINYRRMLEDLTAGRQLVRAVAYLVTKPEVDQTAFVDALTRLGYEIQVKYLKIRPDGSVKGDWAMELSLDVMAMATRLDTVILVTGDGDYVPLVDRLKVMGVRTEVVGFQQNTATELMNAAHAFIGIGDNMLFKEKKFESEAVVQANSNSGTRSRQDEDSIAGRFADEGTTDDDMGVWNDENGDAEADAKAEKIAAQLWENEHKGS
jgi:uncharacterized LabA/DUF88 family protein